VFTKLAYLTFRKNQARNFENINFYENGNAIFITVDIMNYLQKSQDDS